MPIVEREADGCGSAGIDVFGQGRKDCQFGAGRLDAEFLDQRGKNRFFDGTDIFIHYDKAEPRR